MQQVPPNSRTPAVPTPVPLGVQFMTALGQAYQQLRDMTVDGWSKLRRPTTLGGYGWVAALWVVGAGGDAYTTTVMMGSGLFEEANSVAAAGMATIGTTGYIGAATVMCALMMIPSVGRPRGLYGHLVWVGLLAAALGKVTVAISNWALWVG